jgi:uncharacterized circularly permuted ATP-grasp superfamily protein
LLPPAKAARTHAAVEDEVQGAPDWLAYRAPDGCHDGCLDARGPTRELYRRVLGHLERLGPEGVAQLQKDAELSLLNQGITFTVYSDSAGSERIFPFDLVPRLVSTQEWAPIEAGIAQRLRAVNLFLDDLYGAQRVLREGIVPTDLVVNSGFFCREMRGLRVPGGVWVHVAGIDLIQDESGRFVILEDNLRVPSGVSYVLENRRITSRVMPDLLEGVAVRSVDHYPQLLLGVLRSLSPSDSPTVAVLTPGVYNSAYFEHSFLAAEMGALLVEGQDLVVSQDVLYMKTTDGLRRVDVLYRRVDDAFLDPLVFRPDSLLGVPGLMHAYRAGNVVLANAPGTGVVDDKAMYAYLPRIIRYYLDEEPLLPQVPTFLCRDPKDRAYVVDHLDELVLKPTDGSGGYGVLVGPQASRAEREAARAAVLARPEGFVAQPVQRLATLPIWLSEGRLAGPPGLEARHVDLRPFAVTGADGRTTVLPGGLTRVALRRGSLVVNSSQGGGSKDTWVFHGGEEDWRC